MKFKSSSILSGMIFLLCLHLNAAIAYTDIEDNENSEDIKDDTSFPGTFNSSIHSLESYENICQKVGEEFDAIATEEEQSLCFNFTNREFKRQYDNSPFSDKLQIAELIINKDNFFNGSRINPYSRIVLQKTIVPLFCPTLKSRINCINPFKLQTLEKCTRILDSETRSLIDMQMEVLRVLFESVCENNGEKFLDLIDAGFMDCWGQYKKHFTNCFQNYGNLEHLEFPKPCEALELMNECFLDISSLNQSCPKPAISSFHHFTSNIKDWIHEKCETGTGSSSKSISYDVRCILALTIIIIIERVLLPMIAIAYQ